MEIVSIIIRGESQYCYTWRELVLLYVERVSIIIREVSQDYYLLLLLLLVVVVVVVALVTD